jgi:hypothetical protein
LGLRHERGPAGRGQATLLQIETSNGFKVIVSESQLVGKVEAYLDQPMRSADNNLLNLATILPFGKLFESYYASPSGESSWEQLAPEDHSRGWTKKSLGPG